MSYATLEGLTAMSVGDLFDELAKNGSSPNNFTSRYKAEEWLMSLIAVKEEPHSSNMTAAKAAWEWMGLAVQKTLHVGEPCGDGLTAWRGWSTEDEQTRARWLLTGFNRVHYGHKATYAVEGFMSGDATSPTGLSARKPTPPPIGAWMTRRR